MMEKKTFNMIGCCVIRDTFGMHRDDGGYKVNRYVQVPSPISCVTQSPLISETSDEVFEGVKPFLKKCLNLELGKQVFDYVGGVKSDYLMIDCAEIRRILYHFENDGWISESRKDVIQKLIKTGALPEKYEVVDPLDMDKHEIKKFIKAYCEKLLELYEPDRIILSEVKTVNLVVDNSMFSTFGDASLDVSKKMNERMALGFSYMKYFLAGCHIIEFPENVYADANHKWGKSVLHYVPEYYDYALEAVDIIVNSHAGIENEKQLLWALKRKYEILLGRKAEDSLVKSFKEISKDKQNSNKILAYERFFKKCLMQNGKEEIRDFFQKNKIEKCAFYGMTQVSDVFVTWCKEWDIEVLFIIDNLNRKYVYKDIKMIRKDDDKIVDVDTIIICEIGGNQIKESLSKKGFHGEAYRFVDLLTP